MTCRAHCLPQPLPCVCQLCSVSAMVICKAKWWDTDDAPGWELNFLHVIHLLGMLQTHHYIISIQTNNESWVFAEHQVHRSNVWYAPEHCWHCWDTQLQGCSALYTFKAPWLFAGKSPKLNSFLESLKDNLCFCQQWVESIYGVVFRTGSSKLPILCLRSPHSHLLLPLPSPSEG